MPARSGAVGAAVPLPQQVCGAGEAAELSHPVRCWGSCQAHEPSLGAVERADAGS